MTWFYSFLYSSLAAGSSSVILHVLILLDGFVLICFLIHDLVYGLRWDVNLFLKR